MISFYGALFIIIVAAICLFISMNNDYEVCDIFKNDRSWKICFLNKDGQDECRIFDNYQPAFEGLNNCIEFEEGGITQYFCGDYFKVEQVLLDDNCSHLKK
jgi:hypothetical protein